MNTQSLESQIMETKRSKFLRDLKDYEDGFVYLHKNRKFLRSILKKKRSGSAGEKRVNFSSPETSDTQSEF